MRKPSSTDLRAWYVDRADGAIAVISARTKHARLRDQLTAAERAIVARIVAGDSNRAIAVARGTSTRTVANQVAAIFAKLGVASRAELVAQLRAE